MVREQWTAPKTNALVSAVETHWERLFPYDGDGVDLGARAAREWDDLTDDLNARYTIHRHTVAQVKQKWSNLKRDARRYNTDRVKDSVRTSGGGEPEVAENPLLERILNLLRRYEEEALNGLTESGEADGGLQRLLEDTPVTRYIIQPRSRKRRRSPEMQEAPAVDTEMRAANLRVLSVDAELKAQLLANAKLEGETLRMKLDLMRNAR